MVISMQCLRCIDTCSGRSSTRSLRGRKDPGRQPNSPTQRRLLFSPAITPRCPAADDDLSQQHHDLAGFSALEHMFGYLSRGRICETRPERGCCPSVGLRHNSTPNGYGTTVLKDSILTCGRIFDTPKTQLDSRHFSLRVCRESHHFSDLRMLALHSLARLRPRRGLVKLS